MSFLLRGRKSVRNAVASVTGLASTQLAVGEEVVVQFPVEEASSPEIFPSVTSIYSAVSNNSAAVQVVDSTLNAINGTLDVTLNIVAVGDADITPVVFNTSSPQATATLSITAVTSILNSDACLGFVEVQDHSELGCELMLSQWADKPKVLGFLDSYMQSLNGVESLMCELVCETALSRAVGVNLDVIGELLSCVRGSLNDEDYRALLQSKARSSSISGTVQEIIDTISELTGVENVRIEEHYPNTFIVNIDSTYNSQDVVDRVQSITPAGVDGSQVAFSGGAGFVPAEFIAITDQLVSDTSDTFVVDTDGDGTADDNLVTNTGGSVAGGSALAEYIGGPTGISILSEIVQA